MNQDFVALPALEGRSALGYLAALGTVELLGAAGFRPRLSWSALDATARLHCPGIHTIDTLTGAIEKIIGALSDQVLMPGGMANLPPTTDGDTMRMKLTPTQYRELVERAAETQNAVAQAWVASLATDLVLDKGTVTETTLYAATSGQQKITTMLEKPLQMVRDHPEYLREAFVAWRRYSKVTGEYLDNRALFDAADSPTGESAERGVPGATWLALMSFPMIRTTSSDGRRAMSTGWFVDGDRRRRMRWGLWSQPLDRPAIIALWEHRLLTTAARVPAKLTASATDEARKRADDQTKAAKKAQEQLAAIGVFMVCRAERRNVPGRNFDGVLAPA